MQVLLLQAPKWGLPANKLRAKHIMYAAVTFVSYPEVGK